VTEGTLDLTEEVWAALRTEEGGKSLVLKKELKVVAAGKENF